MAPESFEQAMAELAQLVTQMEAGQLPLEASVAAYARGSELVKYCAAQLEKVESQVKVLEGDMLKPFAAEGYSISSSDATATIAYPGHSSQACKA